MKNKKVFALIAGLVCWVIFLAVLVGSCAKDPEPDSPSPDEEQTAVDPTPAPSTSETPDEKDPVEETPEEKPEEKPEEPDEKDPVEETPEEKPEEKPEEPDEDPEETPEDPDEDPEETPEEPPKETTATGTLDLSTKEGIEAVLNDPYMLLVNRDHRVSSDYSPSNLVSFRGGYKLNSTCSAALDKLVSAGKKAGYSYTLYSGYRTYSSQYNKYYNKIEYWENQGYSHDKAVELTNEYYAPPGASEHHTGLAADVCIPAIVNKYACLHENYDQTPEFKWFSSHAHEYGFILRYPKGKESITGYNYEPWHYRYVGVEIATDIYQKGVTFEEYVADLNAKLKSFES